MNTLSPDPAGLATIRTGLSGRLRESLMHLLFEITPNGPRESTLRTAMQHEFGEGQFPRAQVFAAHKMILQAASANDQDAYDRACKLFLALPPKTATQTDLNITPLCADTLGDAGREMLMNAYLDDAGLTNDLIAPPPAVAAQATIAINQAISLMQEFAPEWAQEFHLLVLDIFLAVNRDPAKNGFGGASVFDAFGSLLINPARQTGLAGTFMTLVHESSHARLFLHHLDDHILLNDGDEMYPSPLRSAPRPMEGIFHAAWVSARMAAAADQVLRAGYDGADASALAEQRDAARHVVADCTGPIGAYAKFTELGQTLYDDARSQMSEAGNV